MRKNRTTLTRLAVVSIGAALAVTTAGCSVTGASVQGEAGSGAGTVKVLLAKQVGYTEEDYAAIIENFEAENPDITVEPTFVSYESLHDKIVTSAPAGSYDVVQIDGIWPAEFASKGIIADVTDRFPDAWSEEMLGGALTTTQYDGKYYGVPSGPQTKFLFYDQAVLDQVGASPEDLNTWDGVLDVARSIKDAGIVEYPLAWSWAQAEAIVCDYAQLLGAFGGRFTDDEGNLVVNDEAGVATVEWMKATLDEGLSNPASTTFLEDDVVKTMAQGSASMALNWDSTLGGLQDPSASTIAETAAVLPTPEGPTGERPGVNGAMAFSIAATSKNQDAAWTFVEYLTSQSVQDEYVERGMPVWKASYADEAIVSTNPDLFAVAEVAYDDAIVRPAVPEYASVSQILQVELQNALLGTKTAQQAMDDAVAAADAAIEK